LSSNCSRTKKYRIMIFQKKQRTRKHQ
jgi:hypothetical protein